MFFKEAGIPNEPDVTKPSDITIFSFPQQGSKSGITRNETNALEQLELYSVYQKHWTEHNPSITVYYKDNEFLDVGAWIYNNFSDVSGVSLLPHSDHIYKQAPYSEIDEETYNRLVAEFPYVDWSLFSESEDTTTGTQELACSSGSCEIVGSAA
jgi:ribonucleoside-diphosphate reductase alpha chain